MLVPNPVHVVPFVDVIMVFVVWPTATHMDPFHAIALPTDEKTVPLGVQFTPS